MKFKTVKHKEVDLKVIEITQDLINALWDNKKDLIPKEIETQREKQVIQVDGLNKFIELQTSQGTLRGDIGEYIICHPNNYLYIVDKFYFNNYIE